MSAHRVAQAAQALLRHALPGSRGSVRGHLERAGRIAEAIHGRWRCQGPEQWRLKHVRWYLEHHTRYMAPSTRYDLWRTLRALLYALGVYEDWAPHLRGPWLRPEGDSPRATRRTGRPPRLPGSSK